MIYMINNGIELLNVLYNGQEVNTWINNDVEVFNRIKQDVEVFSATLTINTSFHYGYIENNRIIDNTLLSEVATPINNYNNGVQATNTVTQKAYTPTEKALKNYKYAIITYNKAVGANVGYSSLTVGNVELTTTVGSGNTDNATDATLKLELNDTTNIVSTIKNLSTLSGYMAWSNFAISKIVLTNSEE